MFKCECGHSDSLHVRLPGFPGGAEECQADDCDCGEFHEETSAYDPDGSL
jgi:hypothetical protein